MCARILWYVLSSSTPVMASESTNGLYTISTLIKRGRFVQGLRPGTRRVGSCSVLAFLYRIKVARIV